jgi:hypothetical protein
MTTRTNHSDAPPTGVTTTLAGRRTVAKGIAWTVPVVAVATAAPAFAASCETFTFGAGSCKCPGQSTTDPWGYWLVLCYNCPPGSNANATGQATITGIRNTPNGELLPVTPKPGACATTYGTIPLNGCGTQIHLTGESSGNYLYIDYKVNGTPYQFRIDSPPDCAPVLDANGNVVAQSKCVTAGSCP